MQEVLRLGVDPTQGIRGFQQFRGAADGATIAATGLNSAVLRTAVVMGAAGVALASGASALGRYAQAGGKSLTVQAAFASKVGDAEGAIRSMRSATLGLVDDYELMVQANQALTLGSARTAQDFAELAQVAQGLGRALGLDVGFALNSLNIGIARQSRLVLDNVGLMVSAEKANERYAAALGKAADELTEAEQKEAFRIEAMEQARLKLDELGESALNTGDAFTALGVEIKNTFDALAQEVAQDDLLRDVFDAAGVVLRRLRGEAESYEEILERLEQRARATLAAQGGDVQYLPGRVDIDTSDMRAKLEEAEAFRAMLEVTRMWNTSLSLSDANMAALESRADALKSKADQLRLDVMFTRDAEAAKELHAELVEVREELERVNAAAMQQRHRPGAGIGAASTASFTNRLLVPDGFRSKPGIGEGIGGARFDINRMTNPFAVDAAAMGLAEMETTMGDIAAASRVAAPLLGDFGGSISGIASGIATGGLVGIGTAIVGGVGMIMDGLFDGGVQAQKAALEWERALDDFANAFEPMTELERGMKQAEFEFFAQAQAGANAAGWDPAIGSVEGARAFVEKFRGHSSDSLRELAAALDEALAAYDHHVDGLRETLKEQESFYVEDLEVRMLRAQGMDEQAEALAFQIKQERELAKAREQYGVNAAAVDYLKLVQDAEAAAAAVGDLNDTFLNITSALNSPQGLNMALLTYNASLTGGRTREASGIVPDGIVRDSDRPDRRGDTYNVNIAPGAIVVDGARDPRRHAREIMDEIQRQARTGGGDPFAVTRR